jgi:hypothetical protein
VITRGAGVAVIAARSVGGVRSHAAGRSIAAFDGAGVVVVAAE